MSLLGHHQIEQVVAPNSFPSHLTRHRCGCCWLATAVFQFRRKHTELGQVLFQAVGPPSISDIPIEVPLE